MEINELMGDFDYPLTAIIYSDSTNDNEYIHRKSYVVKTEEIMKKLINEYGEDKWLDTSKNGARPV